jgi:Protein of unknown function (DUF1571)
VNSWLKRSVPVAAVIFVAIGLWWLEGKQPQSRTEASFEMGRPSAALARPDVKLSVDDVLQRANTVFDGMSKTLSDYSGEFVKRERSLDGVLGDPTRFEMKAQTRFRQSDGDAAMRVFLKFKEPQKVAGRKVIWGEDLYDGKMAVHEVGFLLNLKTIWLDPNGIVAMKGERYPISEIGLVRLAEKLIERGNRMRKETGIVITEQADYSFDDRKATLYRIERAQPSKEEDDFSIAEVVIDFDRNLVLAYESYGWPEAGSSDRPLLESYQYLNVQTNIGLTDKDFDVKNPEYGYPSF